MSNVERIVIEHLISHGFKAMADVPNPRHAEFVTVERTGGASDYGRIDRPTVAVQAWSTSRYEASELMSLVDDCMNTITSDARVAKCKRNSMYNYPDESQARYQAVYDLVTY